MTTPRMPVAVDAAKEPEQPTAPTEPWVPSKTNEELERDERIRDSGTLQDYFARMRERGLLD